MTAEIGTFRIGVEKRRNTTSVYQAVIRQKVTADRWDVRYRCPHHHSEDAAARECAERKLPNVSAGWSAVR